MKASSEFHRKKGLLDCWMCLSTKQQLGLLLCQRNLKVYEKGLWDLNLGGALLLDCRGSQCVYISFFCFLFYFTFTLLFYSLTFSTVSSAWTHGLWTPGNTCSLRAFLTQSWSYQRWAQPRRTNARCCLTYPTDWQLAVSASSIFSLCTFLGSLLYVITEGGLVVCLFHL